MGTPKKKTQKTGAISALDCLKCGHHWLPRSEGLPDICPKCKSRKWNDPGPVDLADAENQSAAEKKYVVALVQIMRGAQPARKKLLLAWLDLEREALGSATEG